MVRHRRGFSTAAYVGVAAVAALLLGVGGYFAYGAWGGIEADLASGDTGRVVAALVEVDTETFADESNAELRRRALEALKKAPLAEVFDRMRSADLTEAERARLGENMGQVMRESMTANIDEYEAAPEEEKTAVLDRQLDEWMRLQEEMRAYHEAHKDDPEYQKEMSQRRGRWGSVSREDRKKMMEGRNPDQDVRMFRYFGQVMRRAGERGVNMFGGRPGSGR